jgi:glycosyltransferase involved in cell wall biosynthesis
LVVVQAQSESRQKQGWALPDTGAIRTISLETADGVEVFEQEDGHQVLHVFSGTRGYKPIWHVFKMALRCKSHSAIVGEALNWQGIKGVGRLIISAFDALRIKSSLHFVLAKGELGVQWYRQAGYPVKKILEWAYFTESSNSLACTGPDLSTDTSPLKILYVGQFITRKNILPLIKTYNSRVRNNCELHLIGSGVLERDVRKYISDISRNRIIVHGVVPNDKIQFMMCQADYLVLPSSFDGWGAVVNEALQVGTPCIVSRNAGASILIHEGFNGYIFNPADFSTLDAILLHLDTEILKTTSDKRSQIKRDSVRFNPTSGAIYLKSIIEYTIEGVGGATPVAPWHNSIQVRS